MDDFVFDKSEKKNLIISWCMIGGITLLLTISRIFYSNDVQHLSEGNYTFTGTYKNDGVHYTIDSLGENCYGDVGYSFRVKNSTIYLDDSVYTYSRYNLGMDDYTANLSFTTPSGYSFEFQHSSLGYMRLPSGYSTNYFSLIPKPINESNRDHLLISIADMNDRFYEKINHPYRFNILVLILSLLLFIPGTLELTCPKLTMYWERIRLSRIYEISDSNEIERKSIFLAYDKFLGFVFCMIGLVLLVLSFYCNYSIDSFFRSGFN